MIFRRIKEALKSTRSLFMGKLRALFSAPINDETLSQLYTLFYEADLGPKTAEELTQNVKERASKNQTLEELLEGTKQDLINKLSFKQINGQDHPLEVILVVGVNGSGKTTSIAKLANQLKKEGKKPLLGAADTFRAAAVEQLERWAQKVGVDIVKGRAQGDPAAVVYDTLEAAKSRGNDVVIIDTAGRLQNKHDLMQELEKMKRICNKLIPGAPHQILLTIDANTGQNGIDQAKVFHSVTPLTGLILTKMDGSAKGGVIVPIQEEIGVGVKYITLGEGVEDLQPFDPKNFVQELFE